MATVRAAITQTTWTGDKESMLDKHERFGRDAAAVDAAAADRVSTVRRAARGGGHNAARSSAPDTHNSEKKSPPMAIQNNSRQGETESKDSTLPSPITMRTESVGALHSTVHGAGRRLAGPPLYGTKRSRGRAGLSPAI